MALRMRACAGDYCGDAQLIGELGAFAVWLRMLGSTAREEIPRLGWTFRFFVFFFGVGSGPLRSAMLELP